MSQPPSQASGEYSPAEREILIHLAHRAIESALREESIDLRAPTAHLGEERGAFTTLHLDGMLRGCIGYVLPVAPLYETVARTAAAAAFEDPRFEPVTLGEATGLKIEISVMSRLFPIRPEEVEVGKHGLLVSALGRRGLLLPQVATEHGWDAETFLTETCHKATLPGDCWKRDATLEAFTAEIFSE